MPGWPGCARGGPVSLRSSAVHARFSTVSAPARQARVGQGHVVLQRAVADAARGQVAVLRRVAQVILAGLAAQAAGRCRLRRLVDVQALVGPVRASAARPGGAGR